MYPKVATNLLCDGDALGLLILLLPSPGCWGCQVCTAVLEIKLRAMHWQTFYQLAMEPAWGLGLLHVFNMIVLVYSFYKYIFLLHS